jgi:cbb3-type cytochrome c oxidase subunit III
VRAAAAAAALALLAAFAAAGCGSVAATQEAGSVANGKPLFVENCGQCHVLADAGTKGTIGPSLDEALDDVRAQGFDESTIRAVVRGQIAYPVTETSTGATGMPANLVTGQDAADVAAYVASVAGKPVEPAAGAEAAPPSDPQQLFTQSCGSCHVLADAGTSGTIGPNLDQTKPSLDRAIEQITNGGGGMPAFGDQLSAEQIRALAEYLVEVTK